MTFNVAFIWRSEQLIGKNRDGQTGVVHLLFNAPLARFESVEIRGVDLNPKCFRSCKIDEPE